MTDKFGRAISGSSGNNNTGVTKSYVRANYIESNMEEDIDMKQQFRIRNLLEPIDDLDAVNKQYVDSKSIITENIDMQNQFQIKNLPNPTNNLDAANKQYVDENAFNDGTYVRNNQNNDMGNKLMTNVNMLFVNRDPINPWAVTRKAYVDSHLRICYNDKVNNLNGNRIENVGDPISHQDVATKGYVDSVKPIITIWAEENGSLSDGAYEWSWGGGAVSPKFGYPMMTDGRILRGGVSINPPSATATINIIANTIIIGELSKLQNQATTITIFDPPIEVSQGDFILFQTNSKTGSQYDNLVSLLIELDL